MKPDIKELHKIEACDREKLFPMMIRTFRNYEKLVGSYPDWDDRQAAIEMVIRYYGVFDFAYGNVYSLDENMTEAVMVMFSDEAVYTDERFEAAGCDSAEFRQAASRLSEENIQRWWDFFDELDEKEVELDIPRPHIYVDFLCVSDEVQGQGRGSRIMQAIKNYADQQSLPVMLFTNGEDDVRFYLKNGFRILAVTKSEKFGFENTYVLYEPEAGSDE